jgi:hypothetical protein
MPSKTKVCVCVCVCVCLSVCMSLSVSLSLWRYGLSPLWAMQYVTGVFDKFYRIYAWQE